MQQHLHFPTSPISLMVESIFYYKGYNPPSPYEKILPQGVIQVIIDLTDTPKRQYTKDDLSEYRCFKNGWLSGQQERYLLIESASVNEMIVIQFHPWGASSFFGMPMNEVASDVVELSDILGESGISLLRERILEKQTMEEKTEAVETFFLELYRPDEADAIIRDAIISMQHNKKIRSIAELADQYGTSQRRFIERFKQTVGTTPKVYARILRFQSVIHRLQRRGEIDWADIVFMTGYYDQAHFIKEFAAFSGYTPTEYVPLRGEYVNYISLPE